METWKREELYAEVWERPLVKVAPKYGISAVALGKVCHKLQIPLPGDGGSPIDLRILAGFTARTFAPPCSLLPARVYH
jgi:hypothetical protein